MVASSGSATLATSASGFARSLTTSGSRSASLLERRFLLPQLEDDPLNSVEVPLDSERSLGTDARLHSRPLDGLIQAAVIDAALPVQAERPRDLAPLNGRDFWHYGRHAHPADTPS